MTALILIIFAFIAFLIAAINPPWVPRVNPLGVGLALLTLLLLLKQLGNV